MKATKLVAVFCVVCILLTGCGSNSTLKLSLDRIKASNMDTYSYNDLSWNSTPETVEDKLGCKLGEPIVESFNKDTEYVFERSLYYPKDTVKLLNVKGKSEFEFRDGVLYSMLFAFESSENKGKDFDALNEKVISEMTELYKDGFTTTERGNAKSMMVTRDWSLPFGDDRISHVQVMTRSVDDKVVGVTLGMMCPNPKYMAPKAE